MDLSLMTVLLAWKSAARETGFDLAVSPALFLWQVILLFVQVLLSSGVTTFLPTLPLQLLVFMAHFAWFTWERCA